MAKHLLIVDLEATCWDGNVPGLNRRQTVAGCSQVCSRISERICACMD